MIKFDENKTYTISGYCAGYDLHYVESIEEIYCMLREACEDWVRNINDNIESAEALYLECMEKEDFGNIAYVYEAEEAENGDLHMKRIL